jgi:hypothetical protein
MSDKKNNADYTDYYTQENCGTAFPIYFTIRDTENIHLVIIFAMVIDLNLLMIMNDVATASNLKELFLDLKENHSDDYIFPNDIDEDYLDESDFSKIKSSSGSECYVLAESKNYIHKNMFLFQEEAIEHLKSNHYHYSEEAVVYCHHSWRAPKTEEFLKACNSHYQNQKRIMELEAFIREITNATGKYQYLNETQIVSDAYALMIDKPETN